MSQPVCFRCNEPVADDDLEWEQVLGADLRVETRAMHAVCGIRAIVGGLNHLQGRCTCCGGTEPPDPPDMSRYDAAVAAVAFFQRQLFLRNKATHTR